MTTKKAALAILMIGAATPALAQGYGPAPRTEVQQPAYGQQVLDQVLPF